MCNGDSTREPVGGTIAVLRSVTQDQADVDLLFAQHGTSTLVTLRGGVAPATVTRGTQYDVQIQYVWRKRTNDDGH